MVKRRHMLIKDAPTAITHKNIYTAIAHKNIRAQLMVIHTAFTHTYQNKARESERWSLKDARDLLRSSDGSLL